MSVGLMASGHFIKHERMFTYKSCFSEEANCPTPDFLFSGESGFESSGVGLGASSELTGAGNGSLRGVGGPPRVAVLLPADISSVVVFEELVGTGLAVTLAMVGAMPERLTLDNIPGGAAEDVLSAVETKAEVSPEAKIVTVVIPTVATSIASLGWTLSLTASMSNPLLLVEVEAVVSMTVIDLTTTDNTAATSRMRSETAIVDVGLPVVCAGAVLKI